MVNPTAPQLRDPSGIISNDPPNPNCLRRNSGPDLGNDHNVFLACRVPTFGLKGNRQLDDYGQRFISAD
jgi:hypothetical protein